MAGGLHHHHRIDAVGTSAPIGAAAVPFVAAALDCEQAGGPSPLPGTPACSPLSPPTTCALCATTPARRCCLTLAAAIIAGRRPGFVQRPRQTGKSAAARMIRDAEGSKNHDLTAPHGEAA